MTCHGFHVPMPESGVQRKVVSIEQDKYMAGAYRGEDVVAQ